MKKCKMCPKVIKGRSDKIFCSVACKSAYHFKLRAVNKIAVKEIDTILHRNRTILLELLGKNRKQIKVKRILLEKKKFNYKYQTHFYINSHNKTYHYVYDFAWMAFSTDEILIIRRQKTT